MRLWPFGKHKGPAPTLSRTPVPFPDGFDSELSVLKHHAQRAIGGWLQDRHSACRSPHPWCGPPPQDGVRQFIAEAINQIDANSGFPVLAIYIMPAYLGERDQPAEGNSPDLVEYVAALKPVHNVPERKLVVNMMSDGTYQGIYGPILNKVEDNYSTGNLDPEADLRTFHCDPEPPNGKSWYRESELTPGQTTYPRFHCLELHGEWWIVDCELVANNDAWQMRYHQVGFVAVRDNPDHNFGIFKMGPYDTILNPNNGSELSKAISENCPSLFPSS